MEAFNEDEQSLMGLNSLDYLKIIAQETRTTRKLMSELVRFHREAEAEVPEYMRRFANYMHDLHDISYMYSETGQEPPIWLKEEMLRCDDRMRQLLKREHAEGIFGKIRAEMATDKDNRWDHTRALTFQQPRHPGAKDENSG